MNSNDRLQDEATTRYIRQLKDKIVRLQSIVSLCWDEDPDFDPGEPVRYGDWLQEQDQSLFPNAPTAASVPDSEAVCPECHSWLGANEDCLTCDGYADHIAEESWLATVEQRDGYAETPDQNVYLV